MYKIKIAFLFVFIFLLYAYADTTSLGREIIEKNMVVVMEPKIIPSNISTVFPSCGHIQFTVEVAKKEATRYVCVIALKNDNLSKHWEKIFGRVVKGDQVFIKGELYSDNSFLLVKKIYTKQESFTEKFQ